MNETCPSPSPSQETSLPSGQQVQLRLWVILRVLAPVVVGGTMLFLTRGNRFFDVFSPLVWTLFVTHITATFAFGRTHLLDTGSFFFLIMTSSAAANMSERYQFGHLRPWVIIGGFTAAYLLFSLIGRYKADHFSIVRRSVSMAQVATAICTLLITVVLCSTSKTAVGFLFVPGLLLIPIVLFWSLVSRERHAD